MEEEGKMKHYDEFRALPAGSLIRQKGRFCYELRYVPELWGMVESGDCTSVSIYGDSYSRVAVTKDIRATYPELASIRAVDLIEKGGFVSAYLVEKKQTLTLDHESCN